ncbi:MAG TPA: hypothetical protein VKD67_04385, partial [Acidimicrobiales bacterium]|nr:hypothetical protein [Acidimicrobiales bacterium]
MRRWFGAVVAVATALAAVVVLDGPSASAATPFELLSVDPAGNPLSGTTAVTASDTGQFVAFAQPAGTCETSFRRDRAAGATTSIGTGRLPVITPNGARVASVSCDQTPVVTRWPDGAKVTLSGVSGVTKLAVSASGRFAAVVAATGLSLVDLDAATVTAVASPNGAPASPAFYDDGTPRLGFVSGTVANRIALTAPQTPQPVPGAPSGPISSLSISSHAEAMAFGVGTSVVVVGAGGGSVTLPGGGSEPSVSPDGTSVAITAG